MAQKTITSPLVRVADLGSGRVYPVDLVFDAEMLAAGADQLRILGLSKVRLAGTLTPQRKTDWRLKGTVGATVTQACVVTLDPVRTRIDTPVTRLFAEHWEEPDPDTETEMPDDVHTDPLPDFLDLMQIALEEISLAMPDFPRSEGAALETSTAAPEGQAPLTDEDLKPFAALKALKQKMEE